MDLFPQLLPEAVKNNWKIFYLGSKPGVIEKGVERLRKTYPGLQIEGHHGYFSKDLAQQDSERVIERINGFRPDVLFVGMGMPIQEHWILDHLNELDTCAVLHCGGLMDYIAGVVPTPPRWLGPIGLEWLFRLITEPVRLWKRYLLEPVLLFFLLRRKGRAVEEEVR
jgi:N-acetylglucosaminyldiphosphoundecaprenol N-acetyl-beta-D-mannosaminyltransferase